MINQSHYEIQFSGHLLVLIIVSIILVILAFWSYRFTVPPVSGLKRKVLASLRSAAFILVLFILFEPILMIYYQVAEKPIIAVLADRSASMAVVTEQEDRAAILRSALEDPVWKPVAETHDLRWYAFDDTVTELAKADLDSMKLNGSLTDITGALERVKQNLTGKNFSAAVVLSDGQYNYGSNPENYSGLYGVPVHTVGIGTVTEQKDISILQVSANEVSYAQSKVTADVTIQAYGYAGKTLTLNLADKNGKIAATTLAVKEDNAVLRAVFEFMPAEAGLQKYTVSAVPLAGELTDKNNVKSFYIKVLKNKIHLLLLSGAPGPDHNFLYQTLMANPDYLLTAWIEKPDGSFIEYNEKNQPTKTIAEYDAFILSGYPTANSAAARFESFVEAIAAQKKPWMLLYQPRLDLDKYSRLKEYSAGELMPDKGLEETAVTLSLTAMGKNHALTGIGDSPDESDRYWSEMPPVWISKVISLPHPGTETLVKVDMARAGKVIQLRKEIPVILSRRHAGRRSVLVAAYGLWRLHFMPLGLQKSNRVYHDFVGNAVRWLTAEDDTRPVTVTPSKLLYRTGEKILFSGQVYDEQYRGMSDAEVKVKIRSKSQTADIVMNPIGGGRYEGSLSGLTAGDYSFEASASRGEFSIGTSTGKFSVEEFNQELIHTALNEKTMQHIASASGGRYVKGEQISELLKTLDYKAVIHDQNESSELWNKIFWLFALVVVLSAEWFIRKRSDLL